MNKFTFNTGRHYQPAGHEFAGQHIEVEEANGVVKFYDRSRNIDGVFMLPSWADAGSQRSVRDEVMAHYDANTYFQNEKHMAWAIASGAVRS
jgi:hypothetical protein